MLYIMQGIFIESKDSLFVQIRIGVHIVLDASNEVLKMKGGVVQRRVVTRLNSLC